MLRWPEAEVGGTAAWDRLRECVEALRDLVRSVDSNCLQIEQNRNISRGSIAQQRARLGDQALAKLASFRPFQIAEKAVTENIDLQGVAPQMEQRLGKALDELREGIAATERMLAERCGMREVADGHFRSRQLQSR